MTADESLPDLPEGSKGGSVARVGMNVIAGAIPFAGGLLSAAASAWSEREQRRINEFLHHWLEMLAAEMKEKEQTILEIMSRIDMSDKDTAERVESPAYQSILRKAFRDWAGAESENKRILLRNLLANAASVRLTSDDVVRLFLELIKTYSEFHFQVVGAIYNDAGITRGEIWRKLGKSAVREDSSDADLFRLLVRDLSTGGLIRQHRDTDSEGNFVAKPRAGVARVPRGMPRTIKSAFDDAERYELTALGEQFVHYAMTDLPPKLNFA